MCVYACGTIYSNWYSYRITTRISMTVDQQKAPSPNAICQCQWIKQWHEEECVTSEKLPCHHCSVLKPENLTRVLESVQCSPRRSACKHFLALGMFE